MKRIRFILLCVLATSVVGCGPSPSPSVPSVVVSPTSSGIVTPTRRLDRASLPQDIGTRIALAAEDQVGVTTIYDPTYVRLAYPNGDVPIERGVCTDVVVRAYRAVGIDLQARVHEDMARNFSVYPKDWGMTAPDANIDHRRVQNLTKYFERMGKQIKDTSDASFKPGDVVAWQLSGWMQHIGIVAVDQVPGTNRNYIVHNVGAGTHIEDALHWFTLIGHYRW